MTLPTESAEQTAAGSSETNDAGAFPTGKYAGRDAGEYWKNWKWQVRHAVRSIDRVQQVLGITFDPKERELLRKNSSWKIMNLRIPSRRIKTVRARVSRTDIRTVFYFLSVIPVQCTADTARGNEK